jgi:FlaA1/EpsC-like NDP-sugar epimerase
VERFSAHEVLIAMPSVTGERMREIVAICEKAGMRFKTLPSLTSLIDGNVTINDLRPVNFEDLLSRPPVVLDQEGIGRYLTDKVVAVTGAGGSIGSELCRQIIRFNPAALILIEGSEFNLYRMEMELRTERKFPHIFPAMGRVQDRTLMDRIFAHYRPQVVFHAAACKHVPMVELNPWEAVFNNVLGSHVVMDAAERYGVERCVFISTDKAVRPTNVMGASKRAVELLLQSRPQGKTRYMAVRFGNVVGSSGSAIPLFQSQIKAGGPVTVTHPEMTRYFMTIPEASQLVLQAGSLGEGGEIFVLEMGTPVKIADMARDLIRLSGREPDRDIKIVFTGLRPGEKLYEELITHGEGIVKTDHKKIMVLRRNGEVTHRAEVLDMLETLTQDALAHDAARIKATLNRFIPEYVPSDACSVLCAASRPSMSHRHTEPRDRLPVNSETLSK